VSLIADSLKKAVKEKSVPRWDPSQEVNLVGKRDHLKHPGLWLVFRIGLLIILPTAILVYLIATGVFDFNKRQISKTSDFRAPSLPEEAKAPSSVPLKSLNEKSLQAPAPVQKQVVKEPPVLEKKAAPPEAPHSQEKIETVTKKILPSYPPKKKKETVVSSPSPVLKPEISEAPKTPVKLTEKKVATVVPPEAPATGLGEGAVVPEVLPALNAVEGEKPQPEIAKIPETPLKSAGEEAVRVSPPEPLAQPLVEMPPVLKGKAEVPEVPSAPKPVEEKIPQPEIAQKPEISSKAAKEPFLEEIQSSLSPTIPAIVSVEKVEKRPNLNIEVQKDKRQVASLPSPVLTPEIIRTDPSIQDNVFQNSDFYFNRAIFFQQAKDWQKALDNYVKAEKLDPNNPDTYNNKGVIYKELREYDKALDEFLRAIFLDPNYAKAYNNIGVVYFMQKNYAEGVRNYLKAIDLNPSNLEAFNNLAIIYKKQKDLEKARAVLNRALAMDPDHPGTNYNLAVLYEENKEITPALHYYRRFIELGRISYPALVIQVKTHVETLKPQ
jgi:Tfp pilus assembly protein PilF